MAIFKFQNISPPIFFELEVYILKERAHKRKKMNGSDANELKFREKFKNLNKTISRDVSRDHMYQFIDL